MAYFKSSITNEYVLRLWLDPAPRQDYKSAYNFIFQANKDCGR